MNDQSRCNAGVNVSFGILLELSDKTGEMQFCSWSKTFGQ